jgi:L-malate glycosyltransferase
MLASLATLGLRRTVVWCAPDRTPPPPLRWLVRLLAWARADVIVCLSEFIRQDLIGRSRRLRRLARVVNPGLELERWKGGAIEPGAPRAAVVGHISHIKRTELAIDTCKRVVEVDDRFVLRVIGSPLFRDEHVELERRIRARLAEDRQLGRSVQLLGHQSDVKAALSGCGLLLHARPDEPFGMVMIEAMALGLPVVAPAAGGALEIVEDGLTGLLYQPEDAAAAATCVLRLIDDPALARTMGAEGRRRVEREFLAARQVDSTARLVAAA